MSMSDTQLERFIRSFESIAQSLERLSKPIVIWDPDKGSVFRRNPSVPIPNTTNSPLPEILPDPTSGGNPDV